MKWKIVLRAKRKVKEGMRQTTTFSRRYSFLHPDFELILKLVCFLSLSPSTECLLSADSQTGGENVFNI